MNVHFARQTQGMCPRCMAQRGFTLLELVLAFGLLVVVLGALALSVDLHLRVSQLGRQRVEEAQLARVILQRIADDIRGAVPPQTADFESLAKTLSSLLEGVETLPLSDAGLTESESQGQSGQQTSGGSSQQGTNRSSGSQSSGQMSTGSGGSMSTGSSGSGETSSESGESEEGEEETTETILGVPRSVPGLYGGPDWLQVDVSRIPRPDEYQAFWPTGITGSEGWELNRVSEMKTILYGLMIPGSTMSMSQTLVSTDAWGLYRDEVDRAAGALASEQNVLDQKVRSVGPLAPEVVWLEFWYFDGIQWYDSWDSEAQGGLPVAIEVIIGLDMSRSPAVANAAATELAGSEPVLNEPQTLYRTVIYLPVAQPTASQTASTEELSTGSETSEQSSSGSQ